MNLDRREARLKPAWWTAILVVTIVVFVVVCSILFAGTLRRAVPVTVTSDRAGLAMEPGAKVRMRGVEVGRVADLHGSGRFTQLQLELSPEDARHIPDNVTAQIRASTVFGAKYVDLVYPHHPSGTAIGADAVVRATNVTAEINTVFEDLVAVLDQIDPPKLNAVLAAVAEGVRGQGERIGEATSAANEVLLAVNPRMPVVQQNWQAAQRFGEAYSSAAADLITVLDSAATTSSSITDHAGDLDSLLLETTGLARAGIDLVEPNRANFADAVDLLLPTTNLLMKYNPVYTCLLVGAKWWLDNGGYDALGGNGRTAILDSGFNWGDDPYRYPENLTVVAAKGGPGGRPGCGSLPDATKNFPVRQLITNTGWGTGVEVRPNPGIGHPFWANYLPVTRAVPEPPSVRLDGPPAIGPVPYLGAPPYGAALYGPDGTELYPRPPWAPPPPPPPPGTP